MVTTELEFDDLVTSDGKVVATTSTVTTTTVEDEVETSSLGSSDAAEEEDSGFNSSEEEDRLLEATAKNGFEAEMKLMLTPKYVNDSRTKEEQELVRPRQSQNPPQNIPQKPRLESETAHIEEPPLSLRLNVYLSYGVLILFGYIRMFLERCGIISQGMCMERNREDYVPIYKSWQPFFTEYIYRRVSDIFGQPITGNPGGIVRVLERRSTDHNRSFSLTGRSFDCINLASYDYLGFSKYTNQESIEDSIRTFGVGVAPMGELGRTAKHQELEQMMARYLGKEACIVFGMGYATNAANIPALVTDSSGTLILGDQHSHASVRAGLFLSRATFRFFKHNDFDDLEAKIRHALVHGHPQTGAPWRKVIIIVEGVYSMEGTIVDLPRLVALKKRYKCYLYIDEAHSIGAVGPRGRGVCDYFGVDPAEVDLLMGTMTKSFAAAGGYIAGTREQIAHIRANSASNYAGAMAAPVAQQIINTLKIMMKAGVEEDGEGHRRIRQLLENTHYMRQRLRDAGFIIAGNYDSPVIPIMVYFPSTVGSIVRSGIYKGLALVAAGYPATSLPTCRIRLCMSASHCRQTLDQAIEILSELGTLHHIKYAQY